MSTLFGKRTQKVLSVALSFAVIVWSLGLFALTASVASAATLNEGDIIRGPDGIKVYIINNNGYKRHIFNPEVFNMYGHLKWENIKSVDQTTLDSYMTSDLYRADGDQKVYQTADDGVKRWFNMTGDQFIASGYNFNQVFVVNPKERDFYSTGSEIAYTGTQTTTGALNVSVDSSLAAATIVADSTSGDGAQALADVLKLNFSGNGTVTSVKIHRQGISADSDVSNMYLYDGSTYLADSPIVASNYYTFTNSAGLFTVSGSKTVTVKIDLANGTTSGKTLQFGVVAAADVASNATSLGGTFPMHANVMSTATAADLGKLTLAHVSDPGSSITSGLTDQEIWRFSLASADQKIKVSSIKVTAIGTLNATDLANFKLHDGTTQVGSTVASMASDKTVTFTMSTPYELAAGTTKNISLKADLVAGSSRTFYFEVASARDIVAMDANYGVNVKVNQSDTYSIIKATNTTTISAGTLSITRTSDSASGNVAKDALNVSLAKFNVKATGEAIKVNSLVVRTVLSGTNYTDLNNGKILLDGTQIGTTKDLDSATADDGNAADGSADDGDTEFTFGSSFIVNAGQTRVLEVVADVKKGDGTSYTNETITVTLEAGSSNFIRQSSGTSDSTTETAGNQLTVTAASLTASKNATLANMSVVAGQTGVTIGSWLFTAGASEAVDINTIVVKDDDDAGNDAFNEGFSNMKLYSGSTQLGSTITTPSSTEAGTNTFNLSTPLRVNAGQSVQVDLVADVITGETMAGDDDEAEIDSATGTGVSTNTTITYSGDAAGQTISIASSGTLTVATAATPTNPNSQYVVTGDTAQTVAAWKFSANNVEDLKVTRIKVKQAQADVNAPSNIQNLKLYVGSTQVGATVPALTDPDSSASVDEYAIFEDTNGLFTVAKNSNVTLTLKADITPSTNASLSADGEPVKFRITNATTHTSSTDISAKGTLSGSFAAGSAATDYDGNSHTVVKSKPTFALNSASPSGSLVPGNVEVIRFNITAHSNEDVVFDNTNNGSNIRFTITESGTGGTGNTADLYDASTNTTVATQVSSINLDTAGSIDFTTGLNTTIPAGGTKTYYVKVTLTGYSSQGNSFQLSINNAAADLSWSDNTASADIEDADMSNIGLPVAGNVLVKP